MNSYSSQCCLLRSVVQHGIALSGSQSAAIRATCPNTDQPVTTFCNNRCGGNSLTYLDLVPPVQRSTPSSSLLPGWSVRCQSLCLKACFHYGCAALRIASDSERYEAMSRYIATSLHIVHYKYSFIPCQPVLALLLVRLLRAISFACSCGWYSPHCGLGTPVIGKK